MSLQRILLPILLTLAQVLFSVQASEPVSKSYFSDIAIGGHDTVAYHGIAASKPHKAVVGSKVWQAEWKGANWLFTTEADLDLFSANPERYSPAYNGHCANALNLGEGLIKTDGTHWQIFEDQLYTFYAARGRERWMDGNFSDYQKTADKAWQKIINE
jgi:hypothetical protein